MMVGTLFTEDTSRERTKILCDIEGIDQEDGTRRTDRCRGLPTRHVLAFMAFVGFVNAYAMRVNVSVAVVAMVNNVDGNKGDNSSGISSCDYVNSSCMKGEFDWSEKLQGHVLGSFYYGYMVTQIPAGWLAGITGGKVLFGWGILTTAILCLLTPVVVRTSVYLFIALRVAQGLGEGVIFPAMHSMWGNWAPVRERSRLVTFAYAGCAMGSVIALPITGILSGSSVLGGWPSVFYLFGIAGCVWFVLWMLIVHESPAQHPRINQEEKKYIESSLGSKQKVKTPWKDILRSPAVLAVCAAHFAYNWQVYTLISCLPMFMSYILKLNINKNGIMSAIPFAASYLTQNLSGLSADYIRGRGYLSTKTTRKLFTTTGLFVSGIVLVIVGHVTDYHALAVVFLTVSVGLNGACMAGFNVNHLDVAPTFAGVLMGFSNCVATIPGILAPAVVGFLTNNNQTKEQWQTVFYINGTISVLGTVCFLLFAQGKLMPWAKTDTESNGRTQQTHLGVE